MGLAWEHAPSVRGRGKCGRGKGPGEQPCGQQAGPRPEFYYSGFELLALVGSSVLISEGNRTGLWGRGCASLCHPPSHHSSSLVGQHMS